MSWQSIESAPKDGTEVIAYVGSGYKGGIIMLSFFKINGAFAWRDWDHDIWEPTHWMQTAPPQQGD